MMVVEESLYNNGNILRLEECKILKVRLEDLPDITAKEVKNAVKELENNKAQGRTKLSSCPELLHKLVSIFTL